jgi:NAD(P)-dependent dehydrogenase (short-subunit alcohol dehydrogenase family)
VLSERGAQVALVDRNGFGASRVAAEIKGAGGKALSVQCDVSNEQDVNAAFAEISQTWGGVDVLVANHASHGGAALLDTPLVEWDLELSINLRGTCLCVRAALPLMIARGGGAIVGLGSDCVVRSCRDSAPYMVSKAGVIGLMRSIAIDYAEQGVRANVVTPGVTDTDGLRAVFSARGDLEASMSRAASQSPLGRLGRPKEIAEMIAFVCSDRASFLTGAELLVDGGMTLSYSAD